MANAELRFRIRRSRAIAILQELRGQLRRAPKNDRPALIYRAGRRIKDECLRVVPA